jgi:RHS repeat-associated protein
MDDKERVAIVETRTLGQDGSPARLQRFQYANHVCSALLELDETATSVSYEEYYPYGSTSCQAVNQPLRADAKRYRYIGKERDDETGFSYHGVRYYAPWIGRWASCDPQGIQAGVDAYEYARSNPIRLFDPSGGDPCTSIMCDPQKTLGRAILNTLQSGIDKGDPLAWQTAMLVAQNVWERQPGPNVSYIYAASRVKEQQLGKGSGNDPTGGQRTHKYGPLVRAQRQSSASRLCRSHRHPRESGEPRGRRKAGGRIQSGQHYRRQSGWIRWNRRGAAADMRVMAQLGTILEACTMVATARGAHYDTTTKEEAADVSPRETNSTAKPKAPTKSFVPQSPMVDGVSVNPASWSDSRALGDLGDNYYRWGLPDTDQARVGIARYDAEGNVHLKIYKNDLSTVVSDKWIGKVEVKDLPGKYGSSAFGTAIEERVNQLVARATGQLHVWKHGNTNGVDFQPQFPLSALGPPGAANDNNVKP